MPSKGRALSLRRWADVQRTYDRLAERYDRRWRRYVAATLEATVAGIELEGRERVLDVACGTGELGGRLAARCPGLHLVGIDVSRAMLQRAQAKHLPG